jgi:hypothetical protein
MKRGPYKPRKPHIRMELVPQATADMIHDRCSVIVEHWGQNIRRLGIDHLVLSIYTQGLLDGMAVAERSFGAKIGDELPEPELPLTSEVSSV